MNRIFCTVFILLASVGIFAQEKIIEQSEFDAVHRTSFRSWAGKARREISTHHSSFEVLQRPNALNNPMSSISPPRKTFFNSISEYLPTGAFYSKMEFGSSTISSTRERIGVAGKTYTREDNGAWVIRVRTESPKQKNLTETTDVQIEYKFLGRELLNEKNANVYAKIETSKITNLNNKSQSNSTTIYKRWYDEEGELLKEEMKREIRNEKTLSKFERKTLYQFDPNIKIEVPNLD